MRSIIHAIWATAPRWLRRVFVWWREPHFLVSVAVAIDNDDGEILLCDHVFRKGSSWGMPGGFLEKGEDPEDAIRREVREELGVELNDLSIVLARTYRTARLLEIVYRAKIDRAPEVSSVELRDIGWFGFDELPDVTRDQRMLLMKIAEEVDSSRQDRVPGVARHD